MRDCVRRALCALMTLMMALTLAPRPSRAAVPAVRLSYDNTGGQLALVGAVGATDVSIPEQVQGLPVTEIAANAFAGSPNLWRVQIPASVTYINSSAFSGCKNLTEVVVDDANINYTGDGGGLFDKEKATLIAFAEGVSGEVSLPDSLRTVDARAFGQCEKLTAVKFSEGLIAVGEGAFVGCTALKRVDLPASLEALPLASPFSGCTGLTHIGVAKDNPSFEAKDGALWAKGGERLLAYPGASGKVSLPEGLPTIGGGAFSGAEKMTELKLPTSLYWIESFAFEGCVGLTRIDVPEGVAVIERGAFDGCANLELICLPTSAVDIGEMALSQDVLIQCERGSVAETFAKESRLMRLYVDPATGETTASTPEDDLEPDEAPEPTPAPSDAFDQILAALNDPLISATYDHLKQGGTIQKGDKREELKGLQQLLNLLGGDLTVDGSIGAMSMEALNKAQLALGLDATGSVTLKEYGDLLLGTVIAQPSEQRWPEDGEVFRNDDYSNTDSRLIIQANRESGQASYVKLYAQNGQLVSAVFIAGAGSAEIRLPGGTYVIKVGVGVRWYGPDQAFGMGGDSFYSRLTFDGGADTATFAAGRQYTLKLSGVQNGNVDASQESADTF